MDPNQLYNLLKVTGADQRIVLIVQIALALGFLVVMPIMIKIFKERIKSQESTISQMQAFMSIFKIDEVKKYVEIKEDRIKAEKELVVKSIEDKAIKSIKVYVNEFQALFGFSLKVISILAINPQLNKAIEDMPDSISKSGLIRYKNETEDYMRRIFQDPDFLMKGLKEWWDNNLSK